MKFQLSEYDMVSVLHYLFTANKGSWHKLIKPALISAAFCVFVGIIANNANFAIGAYITAGILLIVIPGYNHKKTIKIITTKPVQIIQDILKPILSFIWRTGNLSSVIKGMSAGVI